jgi:hypothetical protein
MVQAADLRYFIHFSKRWRLYRARLVENENMVEAVATD